jgi:hypothetical protein
MMSIDEATPAEWDKARKQTLKEIADGLDLIHKPPHYNKHGDIECIDAIREVLGPIGFKAYLHGNIMKYAWRADMKGEVADMRKMIWYAKRWIEETESE